MLLTLLLNFFHDILYELTRNSIEKRCAPSRKRQALLRQLYFLSNSPDAKTKFCIELASSFITLAQPFPRGNLQYTQELIISLPPKRPILL